MFRFPAGEGCEVCAGGEEGEETSSGAIGTVKFNVFESRGEGEKGFKETSSGFLRSICVEIQCSDGSG